MAIDDKIKALTKQLFPTGRVWRINPGSIKEKFVNGLLASEIRAYNNAVSILDSSLPDNPNFTVDDASAWEKRLGLADGTGIPLNQRMDAIKVQLNWPGTNPAKAALDYIQDVLQAAGYNICVHENLFITPGITWTLYSGTSLNTWTSIAYGGGLFVAVASSGGNQVMTSPDGITWTARTAAENNSWSSIAYGNGLFVVVSETGLHKVMTSPDGITWTARTDIGGSWESVTYGAGLFVAVSSSGGPTPVMTSPDGITWTGRASTGSIWRSITYGNSLYVAIASGGPTQVMTSPDGITWTDRTASSSNNWVSVTYGGGLFVAVSNSGVGNRVMSSPDGITWTSRASAADNDWSAITYGNGLFVAVSNSGAGNRIMTSPDGITWTIQNSPADNSWSCIVYGNSLFVAAAVTGYPNNVMRGTFGSYFYKTYVQFANTGLVRHISTLLHGQQRHGYLSRSGIIVANSVDPSVDDSFDPGDYSDTIFIGGCPAGTFVNIPKEQETAFRQLILKIKPVNITVLLLVNFV